MKLFTKHSSSWCWVLTVQVNYTSQKLRSSHWQCSAAKSGREALRWFTQALWWCCGHWFDKPGTLSSFVLHIIESNFGSKWFWRTRFFLIFFGFCFWCACVCKLVRAFLQHDSLPLSVCLRRPCFLNKRHCPSESSICLVHFWSKACDCSKVVRVFWVLPLGKACSKSQIITSGGLLLLFNWLLSISEVLSFNSFGMHSFLDHLVESELCGSQHVQSCLLC